MSDQIEFNNECSMYADDCDPEDWVPCRCPVCKGFLPGDIYQDPLVCKRCGSELVAIETSEARKESDDYEGEAGRICIVTRGNKHKQRIKEDRSIKQSVKQGHDKWKAFL